MKKLTKGQEVYWMSIDNNYLQDCIPICQTSMPRVHKGTVVSDVNQLVKIRTNVNKKFIEGFEGMISGVELIKPSPKLDMCPAIIGMRKRDLHESMNDVKLAIIDFVMNDFDGDKIR